MTVTETLDFLPRILPPGWVLDEMREDGARYIRNFHVGWMTVILSMDTQADGKRWLHLSVSRDGAKKLPSWEDMVEAKELFLGAEAKAIQVFPPRSEHYSIGEVLHLWSCLDGDGLPDFRGKGLTI
jgi:hypothetical protein